MTTAARVWAVVPAAGSGVRMDAALPKQYLPLVGRTVIEHALAALLAHARIVGLTVALAPGDPHWHRVRLSCDKPVRTVAGGVERAHSVLNGLQSLRGELRDDDWVLVHDAVRPCLRLEDVSALVEQLADDPVGGILATPLVDTLKRVDENKVVRDTPARRHLWRALTPQMFRYGLLLAALRASLARVATPTDEAAAMESAGHAVRVVEGRSDNLKITRPEDLALAEAILKQRGEPNS